LKAWRQYNEDFRRDGQNIEEEVNPFIEHYLPESADEMDDVLTLSPLDESHLV